MSFSKTFIVSILANSLNISRDICAARKKFVFIDLCVQYLNITISLSN